MLRVHAEQMEAMDEEARARFHEDLLQTLRDAFPEAADRLGDRAAALEWIAGIDERAAAHGLRAESDVIRFVTLCFLCGDDVDERPEMAPVFAGPAEGLGERIDALLAMIAGELASASPEAG